MKSITLVAALLVLVTLQSRSQEFDLTKTKLEAVKVSMSTAQVEKKNALKVVKDGAEQGANESSFAKLPGVDFKDGTIEVRLLSRLLPNAGDFARGFIGVAFRINDDNSKFEGIYLRPTNGRADDQVRRNHSIQYFSHPGYDFQRFRNESPEKYESYADMGLNEWIKMKIVVKAQQAKLYLNDNVQPSLIVNDLKLGPDASGTVGLWVENGTEGYFADLKISK
jgi:hypothetical protein